MILLLDLPGGSEWILIIVLLIFFFTMPILALVFYLRNRELKKQIKILTEEKNVLLDKFMKSL